MSISDLVEFELRRTGREGVPAEHLQRCGYGTIGARNEYYAAFIDPVLFLFEREPEHVGLYRLREARELAQMPAGSVPVYEVPQ